MTLSLGPGLLRGLSPLCWQCPGLRYHNGQNLPLGLGKWMTGPCPGILPGEAAESCPFCARHVSSSELSYQVGSGKIPKVQMGKLRPREGKGAVQGQQVRKWQSQDLHVGTRLHRAQTVPGQGCPRGFLETCLSGPCQSWRTNPRKPSEAPGLPSCLTPLSPTSSRPMPRGGGSGA